MVVASSWTAAFLSTCLWLLHLDPVWVHLALTCEKLVCVSL